MVGDVLVDILSNVLASVLAGVMIWVLPGIGVDALAEANVKISAPVLTVDIAMLAPIDKASLVGRPVLICWPIFSLVRAHILQDCAPSYHV